MNARPSFPTDRIEAERFIRETYEDNPKISRVWLANNRDQLLRYAMDCVSLKRRNAQHKEHHRISGGVKRGVANG